MRRRDLIQLVAAAAAFPRRAARAQQPTVPVVGFMNSQTSALGQVAPAVLGFRQGLRESGYIEGENITIEYRWGEDRYDQLPALAAELVARRVNVLVATGGAASVRAAKAATATIPIVFWMGGDPVKLGLVASLSRPGGNMTGVTFSTSQLGPKRLGLLCELIPASSDIGVLTNPNEPDA